VGWVCSVGCARLGTGWAAGKRPPALTPAVPGSLPCRDFFRIRVMWYHRAIRPAKYVFSASLLASFLAWKIDGFCGWLCRTLCGHLISQPRILTAPRRSVVGAVQGKRKRLGKRVRQRLTCPCGTVVGHVMLRWETMRAYVVRQETRASTRRRFLERVTRWRSSRSRRLAYAGGLASRIVPSRTAPPRTPSRRLRHARDHPPALPARRRDHRGASV
jgi:hypothetical protein